MGELSLLFKFLPLTGVLLLALYPLILELLLLAANTFYLMLAMAELGFKLRSVVISEKFSADLSCFY